MFELLYFLSFLNYQTGVTIFDILEMLQREVLFYELFTNKLVTEWGILYFNPENPSSYDSNHAHILDVKCNLKEAVEDIVKFYQKYGITPRIYTSSIVNELEMLQPILEQHCFTIKLVKDTFMLFQRDRVELSTSRIDIHTIKRISKSVSELVYSGNDEGWGEWGIKLWREAIRNPNFHLLGLFHNGKCMSVASLHLMNGYSRVDDVKTHANFRGRHFGTQLISYLAVYHRNISENNLYLWSDNPIAIRIYKNVGFQELNINVPRWTAFIE